MFFIIFIIISVLSSTVYSETARFDVTRDVWVSAYPGEENHNMGASSKLKLKGIQEMAIFDFDLSSLKGKKVESARLYLCDADENNKLRKIGVSTVASPWVEGKSKGHLADVFGEGATFNFSSYKRQRWAGEGSDLTDVTMGNGNTWQHHTELKREKGDWWSVDIAPELIQALIAKKSYGLLVMDESGQTFANNYIFSRESNYQPYLMITYSDAGKQRPLSPDVELQSSLENAHLEYGAVILKIYIKEEIFAFEIFINDEKVPLWRIPRPGALNSIQEIIVDWLPPEQEVTIKISAVDELGQRSEPALVKGHASRALSRIAFSEHPPMSPLGKGGNKGTASRHFRIWAVPDVTKIDPVSGRIISEANVEGFDRVNPIWSEDEKQIALSGIKGEIIGFQLCIEMEGNDFGDIGFRLTSLKNKKGNEISAGSFNLYQVHYLKVKERWYPELAIPMRDGIIDMKLFQKSVGKRKNQMVYIDINIPTVIEPGLYSGKINIFEKGEFKESLNINLDLKDISMPQKLTFVPELNMYNGPGKAGTERFLNAHRIAHEHRAVINRVPYSQDGKIHVDMFPEITYSEAGNIKINWTDYDKRLGSIFDGTAFVEGARKGIPVEKFYLPFFENWPSELASNYKFEFVSEKTQEIISDHALKSLPLNEALTSDYENKFIQIIKAFKSHFEEKGWNQTEFQFYLNNKWKWKRSSSWWNLDEPVFFDDWMALRFFGSLFKEASGKTSSNFIFRADISRPQWQSDWLNGILNRMYVQNKVFFKHSDRVRKLKGEGKINFSVYGSLNDIDSSNHQTVMWCMRCFVEGADGVLPWQSLGGSKAFLQPDRNALIVDAKEAAGIDWVVSLRVNALRRCQQNVELLSMLEKKNGYKREQIRAFFYRYFNIEKSNDHIDNMDSFIFQNVDTNKMENFRNALIEMFAN